MEEGEMEVVTLVDVLDDGETLVLLDGRALQVNPGDIPTAALWLPTSDLEVWENDSGRFYDLSVKIQGSDVEIRARWK